MVVEDIPALSHKLVEHLTVLTVGEVILYALTENIVGAHKVVLVVATVPENTVAVAYAGVEAEDIVTECGVKSLYKLVCLSGGDLVRAVVKHYLLVVLALVGESNDIASVSHVVFFHCKTHAHRLEGGATLGIHLGVKGEYRHICGIAFGHHAIGYVGNRTYERSCGKHICSGLVCGSHRGFTAKSLYFFISHSVRNENKIFHQDAPREEK